MTSIRSVSARRAFVGGAWRQATVRVHEGTIVSVEPFDEHADVTVADHEVLIPGLVDSHVHLNDPGRSSWEGFESGTAAAAAGGVTTVVDMPLNSRPVTTDPAALSAKRAAAADRLAVDVAYWGGAVPDNLGRLADLADAGVRGFKCFLAPSGVEDFPELDSAQLRSAMSEVAALGSVLIVHAEDPAHLRGDGARLGREHARFEASRPPISERAAVHAVIEAAEATGARAHVVHLSDAGSLPLIRAAKARGVRITAETCPHYLTLASEDIPPGATEFKCCPPIRGRRNQGALWDGVLDGTIEAIVSDHSPSTSALKRPESGDFGEAWGGISGLQTGLTTVWSAARERGIPLDVVLPLFTTGPARVAGLVGVGELTAGALAHLTVFDPDRAWTIDPLQLLHRTPVSPWEGTRVHGSVSATYVGGELAYSRGSGVAAERNGRELIGSGQGVLRV